jgi:uncharacterized protein YfaT (DUF1175 family)
VALAAVSLALAAPPGHLRAQMKVRTATDRAALRAWFLLLVDAQFYRATPDVTDCAALVRHAVREAIRPHTPEWFRRMQLPVPQIAADLAERPAVAGTAVPLFRVAATPPRYAEFADAKTLVQLNAHAVGRDLGALRPGDLLYFAQRRQALPDHVMVFVGSTTSAPAARDWIVYHTGPSGADAGEVRKVRLADLIRHPSPRWRPVPGNPAFVGVFRLHLLS